VNFTVERGFGRCPVKFCRKRQVIYVAKRKTQWGFRIDLMHQEAPGKPLQYVDAGWAGWPGQREVFEQYGLICPDHGTPMEVHALKARYNPSSPCSDKCLTAIGPDCECECAGKNHGKRAGSRLR